MTTVLMNSNHSEVDLARVPTGIRGLDVILNGGLLQGGVYIVQGAPGAGKTILANEVCFRHAASGGKTVYVTLLAESHTRMLQHLRTLSFFDEEAIPDRLYYVSAFRVLEEEGLKGLVDLIRREIKGQKASLLVLDGLVAAEESAPSDREFKKFIHELQSHVASHGCTAMLLTSGATKAVNPEHTMVDGLIELENVIFDVRTERNLCVRKFRGSPFLRGRHSFRITGEGLMLYPRIEAQYARPTGPAQHDGRYSTGVDGLDEVLGGGVPVCSVTGLVGPTGTGKTILSLHFLSLSSKREPGLYFGFFEPPERLLPKAASIGLDLEKRVREGDLEIMWYPQGENMLDELAHNLLDAVARRGVKRLVLDGLPGLLEAMVYPERLSRFLACLTNELRARAVTTCLTLESREISGMPMRLPVSGASALIENLFFLRFVEQNSCFHRLLSVEKVRDSGYDPKLRRFVITERGIQIGEPFYGSEGLLTGNARASTGGTGSSSPETKKKKRKS
jgi:circadian clock protein KaiC